MNIWYVWLWDIILVRIVYEYLKYMSKLLEYSEYSQGTYKYKVQVL